MTEQMDAEEPETRTWMSRAELVKVIREAQADPGLRDDLRWLAGETTADLGPIR